MFQNIIFCFFWSVAWWILLAVLNLTLEPMRDELLLFSRGLGQADVPWQSCSGQRDLDQWKGQWAPQEVFPKLFHWGGFGRGSVHWHLLLRWSPGFIPFSCSSPKQICSSPFSFLYSSFYSIRSGAENKLQLAVQTTSLLKLTWFKNKSLVIILNFSNFLIL